MLPNLQDVVITPAMLRMIGEIDAFKGEWMLLRGSVPVDRLHKLKQVATIQSVGSSCRIEGNELSDTQIETLFNNISRQSFATRSEQEVAGYRDLINLILESYRQIPLSENYIKQMHKILLKYSEGDAYHAGEYKKIPNRVAAFDGNGKEIGSIFETASPFDTPRLMRELLIWTNDNLQDGYLHPVLVIGIFIVHFLAIHPFNDGNGRLSRALTVLLLLQKGYEYMPYSSMENIVEQSKESYYLALRRTQKNIWQGKVDYEPWLTFFIMALQKQVFNLRNRIANLNNKSVSRMEQRILDLFKVKNNWQITAMEEELKVNRETLKKAVQSLVRKELLRKNGSTKGAWYSLREAEMFHG